MRKFYLLLIFICCNYTVLFAQNISQREAEKIKEEAETLVRSLPEYLNYIGGNESSNKEKERAKEKMLSLLFVDTSVLIQRDFQLSATSEVSKDNSEAIKLYVDNIDIKFSHWKTVYSNFKVSNIYQNKDTLVCVTFDRILEGSYDNGIEVVSSDKTRKLDAFVKISKKNKKWDIKISGISFHDPNRKFNFIKITESAPKETISIYSPADNIYTAPKPIKVTSPFILGKPLIAALVSIPLPGYGDKLNRENKKRAGWWLETALVYGLVGGSIYMNNQSQDYYKQYNAALEPEQRTMLFDKANLYNKISITSQWTGLAYWGLDIYLAYKTARKIKNKNYSSFAPMLQKPKPFWSASMQPSGFSLVYSF